MVQLIIKMHVRSFNTSVLNAFVYYFKRRDFA